MKDAANGLNRTAGRSLNVNQAIFMKWLVGSTLFAPFDNCYKKRCRTETMHSTYSDDGRQRKSLKILE